MYRAPRPLQSAPESSESVPERSEAIYPIPGPARQPDEHAGGEGPGSVAELVLERAGEDGVDNEHHLAEQVVHRVLERAALCAGLHRVQRVAFSLVLLPASPLASAKLS